MSRAKGRAYEERARSFLKEKGFEIIESNFYSRFGEIDIIAKKGSVLHFIEVKGGEPRGAGQSFDPIYAITPKKIAKMIKTIDYYLTTNRLNVDYCLDGLSIWGDEIQWIENITI